MVRCLLCVGSWRRDSQMDNRMTLSTGLLNMLCGYVDKLVREGESEINTPSSLLPAGCY